ncbi:MAG TPA: hypothetical protein VI072_19210 [Polyangiaceae bacterium]
MGALDALERPATARFGWCAALALLAHGVLVPFGLALAQTHATASPPLAPVIVDLEAPEPRAGGNAQQESPQHVGTTRSSSERRPAPPVHRGKHRSTTARAVVTTGAVPAPGVGAVPAELTDSSADAVSSAGARSMAHTAPAGELGASARGEGGGSGTTTGTKGTDASAHGPRLLVAKPCQGMFPASANDDIGVVTLALQVGQEGVARRARILDEHPRGQGFARAALSCVPRLTFDPATRDDGTRTAATSTVRLRFVRHL